jgi:membrane associated rhomboid family serine protease
MINATVLIIAATALVSIVAFSNGELMYKLRHWPYQEARRNEYYRWITSGLLHADPMHLIFNMVTLYFFGRNVEGWFFEEFGAAGQLIYVLFYVLALAASSSATFYKYRNTPGFASIGASGATAAVLFAAILLDPTNEIYLFIFPIGIPGFIFAILYLWYSNYAARHSNDNIDHTAHFFGAVFGFFFPLLLQPSLIFGFFSGMIGWFHYIFGS